MLIAANYELVCNKSDCPARYAQEVELYGQAFRFCQHHFNELEPTLLTLSVQEYADA